MSNSGRPALPKGSRETLLLIGVEVVNAEGVVLVRTIWATTSDRRCGHRRTDIKQIASEAAFLARMVELAPAICWQPAEPRAADRSLP
jgi:hypothetical protein